ncbi:hypothetical protein [Micavibrio aeruginosavorus]|uniref:Uncharacterized protein n=1 Tax=Micavibrio aeruginosavorus EPB TaxID=349215 RepID=M4VKQ4_9BACT|nr:hypothetical protein [Micavibrio aeruginosavorus]AGH99075.1 hypothetical protein A11S_2280 [Micavibrio aeruginosavorus EPB]
MVAISHSSSTENVVPLSKAASGRYPAGGTVDITSHLVTLVLAFVCIVLVCIAPVIMRGFLSSVSDPGLILYGFCTVLAFQLWGVFLAQIRFFAADFKHCARGLCLGMVVVPFLIPMASSIFVQAGLFLLFWGAAIWYGMLHSIFSRA